MVNSTFVPNQQTRDDDQNVGLMLAQCVLRWPALG